MPDGEHGRDHQQASHGSADPQQPLRADFLQYGRTDEAANHGRHPSIRIRSWLQFLLS